jgi:hypothetical protein
MPGVAFDLSAPAHAKPTRLNIKRIVGVVTYGLSAPRATWRSEWAIRRAKSSRAMAGFLARRIKRLYMSRP